MLDLLGLCTKREKQTNKKNKRSKKNTFFVTSSLSLPIFPFLYILPTELIILASASECDVLHNNNSVLNNYEFILFLLCFVFYAESGEVTY